MVLPEGTTGSHNRSNFTLCRFNDDYSTKITMPNLDRILNYFNTVLQACIKSLDSGISTTTKDKEL